MSQFRLHQMVFAKCQNYPYWPGKIIGIFSKDNSYKVLFYGEKSQATIDSTYIIPFNDETYRKIITESASKNNKSLKYSLSVAIKRFNKRKKGVNSSSEEDDFLQETELTKKNDSIEVQKSKGTKMSHFKQREPEDPHIELGVLLNALSNQASHQKKTPRIFTEDQEKKLKQLLDPNCDKILLASLIEFRVIERFIVTLKELDLWGLKQHPELSELQLLVKKRYEDYKSVILSPDFAAIPLREAKRERIIQKVTKNKAVI